MTVRGDTARRDAEAVFDRVWGNPTGWRALTVVNHTSVGLRFMVTGGLFFLLGGLMAMLMRTQLALPEQDILSAEVYNQLFTMHGTTMMFLFAVPMAEGLALYLIPKMIGARDLLFPRLSAFGYFCYLLGGMILLSSLVLGTAPNSGWFMYTPLSSDAFSPGSNSDFWLIGVTFVEISAVAAGAELVVSILRSRAPGMALQRMPLFAWYILVVALMILIGFPPLILGSILLELERAAGWPFFDVTRGGDPLLWQHLFWLFGHPEVYIIFLPGAAIVSTILPVFAQRPIVGYRWVVLALIATGFVSFGLWVHHMFTVGIPHLAQAFFSLASMLVALPTGIQVFAWLATLWTGRPLFRLPMLWLLGFLIVFVAGGLTGVMLALVPFDWQVHDTHFVVAHMHYVLIGGLLFPLGAGLYYWLPHVSGRLPSETLGRWGFWMTLIGFNLTFLIMHLTGLLGMPRRVFTYESGLGWDLPNLLSSVGGFIMAAGIAMVLVDLTLHFRFGRPARSNPWNADTLEWATQTPPAAYNFMSLPDVRTRHPLWQRPDLQESVRNGEHALPSASHGRRETLGTSAVAAEVSEIIHLPGNSWLPLGAAVAIAVLCVCLLLKVYALAAAAALLAVLVLCRWAWQNGVCTSAHGSVDGTAGGPQLHWLTTDGPGRWGLGATLLANAALFLSLLFGWFYLWTVSPNWRPPAAPPFSWEWLGITGLALTATVVLFGRVVRRLRAGAPQRLVAMLGAVALLGTLVTGALALLAFGSALDPTTNSRDALLTVLLLYLIVHSGLGALMTALQCWRAALGYVGADLPYEPIVVAQWWGYTLAVFWISYVAVILLPLGWTA